MKKIFYIVIIGTFLSSCANILYPEYKLNIKNPVTTPDLTLEFSSDTTGTFYNKNDTTVRQNFGFIKVDKYYLKITKIDTCNLVSIKKGDTLVYIKKGVYIFNKQQRLVFIKK